jgi:mannose-6-phosphate isomerase
MRIDPCNVYKLKGAIQHYAWGGYEYIPRLLGIDNADKQPFAEYWMGAHNSAPSQIQNGENSFELNELLRSHPELLGSSTEKKFKQLPYLFKVLDVREMLSIQVHPTKEEAEKGFDAEEERGVEIKSPQRNYKDRNHKPEVLIALSDFWLLHGFKPKEELKATLSVPQFRSLLPVFESGGYEGLYRYVMEFPQKEVDAMLLPLVQKEVRRRSFHESERNETGYWVGEYYLNKETKNIDKGIFAVYFFNLVYLQPGQAVFQGAGVPHAYLCGQNIELMANSDNVLRAGLTNKHIAVDELMKHTKFEAVHPKILTGEQTGKEKIFRFPVDDFMLGKIRLNAGDAHSIKPASPEILICIEGSVKVKAANSIELNKGEAFIAFAGCELEIRATSPALIFRAAVPE